MTISHTIPENTTIKLIGYSNPDGISINKNINYIITSNCTTITPKKEQDYNKVGRAFLQVYTNSSLISSSLLYSFEDQYLGSIMGR